MKISNTWDGGQWKCCFILFGSPRFMKKTYIIWYLQTLMFARYILWNGQECQPSLYLDGWNDHQQNHCTSPLWWLFLSGVHTSGGCKTLTINMGTNFIDIHIVLVAHRLTGFCFKIVFFLMYITNYMILFYFSRKGSVINYYVKVRFYWMVIKLKLILL